MELEPLVQHQNDQKDPQPCRLIPNSPSLISPEKTDMVAKNITAEPISPMAAGLIPERIAERIAFSLNFCTIWLRYSR